VGIDWDKKKGTLGISLKSKKNRALNLVLPPFAKRVNKGLKNDTFNQMTKTIENLELQNGKVVVLDIRI
jgi:hypothetical protein